MEVETGVLKVGTHKWFLKPKQTADGRIYFSGEIEGKKANFFINFKKAEPKVSFPEITPPKDCVFPE